MTTEEICAKIQSYKKMVSSGWQYPFQGIPMVIVACAVLEGAHVIAEAIKAASASGGKK